MVGRLSVPCDGVAGMAKNDILVLGASGTTGRRVVAGLRARALPVRPASRSGAVRFDWSDPATWEPALAGASRLYLMAPHELPVDPAFVHQAVDQGVERIVLLSSRAIEVMGDERLQAAERTVRDSGAEWTIIRPDWFNQNFDEGVFRPAVDAGELAVPLADTRFPFIDADDIAAVATTALTEDGHAGLTYEITGPEALSFADALERIGKATGRTITFHDTPDAYRAAMSALGLPAEQIDQEITAFTALQAQGDGTPTDTVHRVTGRAPKDFDTYVAEAW
ncbi:NmrA family protein [Actinokineospora fastidiosa]|uniref:NmrA family protein n=2 Tax=Actinokineospora fastidiosa TaxID=1816 RepID=A0A918GFF0_9PSEU|nr:NmrA family protein [Actinokineospora fastidiosa]